MDKDYLQNIAGSPYTEGLGRQIGARMRSGMKNVGAMVGGHVESKEYTYIRGSFNNFLRRVMVTLNDFAKNVDRLRTYKPSLTPQQNQIVDTLMELHDMIRPGSIARQQYNAMANTSPWTNPQGKEKYSRGIYYGPKSQKPNPSRNYPATGTNPSESSMLSELINEGMTTRKLPLNKAWMTRDSGKILSAYLKDIYDELNSFYAEVKKLTGKSPMRALEIMRDINRGHANFLQKVISAVKASITSPKGATPTGKPMSPDEPLPPETPATPPQSGTPPGTPPAATPPVAPASAAPTGGATSVAGDDFAKIVDHVMGVMIGYVKKDKLSADYYVDKGSEDPKTGNPQQAHLPSTWDEPSIHNKEKEKEKQQSPGGSAPAPAAAPVKEQEEDEPGSGQETEKPTGDFLYDFRSALRKANNFAVEMGPPTDVELSGGRKKKIRVIWSNQTHKNEIRVKYQNLQDSEGEKKDVWKEIVLFKFNDHQADTRGEDFKTGPESRALKYLKQAHPMEDPLKGASPQTMASINSKMDDFNRALYATIDRKAMEFTARELRIEITDKGTIFITNRLGEKKELTTDDLMDHVRSLNKDERIKWIERLSELKWFERNHYDTPNPEEDPDTYKNLPPGRSSAATKPAAPAAPAAPAVEPPLDLNAPNVITTIGLLKGLKYNKSTDYIPLVTQAVNKLGKDATPDELLKASLAGISKAKTTVNKKPAPDSVNKHPEAKEALNWIMKYYWQYFEKHEVGEILAGYLVKHPEWDETAFVKEFTKHFKNPEHPDWYKKDAEKGKEAGKPPPTSPVSGTGGKTVSGPPPTSQTTQSTISKSVGGEPGHTQTKNPQKHLVKKKKNDPDKGPVTESGLINPFQRGNFL